MTARLVAWWTWAGRHRQLLGWCTAAVYLAVFSGGVALGATRVQDSGFREPGVTPAALARRSARSVEVVVIGTRPTGLVTRTRDGDLLFVRTPPGTVFRQRGKAAEASAVTRGSKLVVLGRPGARAGVMIARTVAIRGRVALAAPTSEGEAQP